MPCWVEPKGEEICITVAESSDCAPRSALESPEVLLGLKNSAMYRLESSHPTMMARAAGSRDMHSGKEGKSKVRSASPVW